MNKLLSLALTLTLCTSMPGAQASDGHDDPTGTIAGSGSPSVTLLRFSPSVIRTDDTDLVTVTARIAGGVPDRVMFRHEGGAEMAMRDDGKDGDATAGDAIYSLRLPAPLLLEGLQADDVHRKLVGFIDVYLGETRVVRLNAFIPVWSPEMGTVDIAEPSEGVRYTNYVLNIADPAIFAAGPTPFDGHTALVRRFYQYFGDDFDFIDIVFDAVYPMNRHHITLQNQVAGIGVPPMAAHTQYGSTGRLLGLNVFPINTFFDGAARSHSHEIGHQWINFLNHPALAPGRAHWPLSSMASGTMGFSIPGSGAGGDFKCTLTPAANGLVLSTTTAPRVFSDIDLYLMGLLPAAEVGTHYVYKDPQAGLQHSLSCNAGVLPYTMFDAVSIDAIIAAAGPRVPAYPGAQRDFRVAVIVVSEQPLSAEAMAHYHWFAHRAEAREPLPVHEGFTKMVDAPFYAQTGGRATLSARLRDGAGAGSEVEVWEFYAPSLDHYFMTANASDIEVLTKNPQYGWHPTG